MKFHVGKTFLKKCLACFAVCDVLYEKKTKAKRGGDANEAPSDDSDSSHDDSGETEEVDTSESEDDEDVEDYDDGAWSIEEVQEDPGVLDKVASSLIKKVQKICRKFRKSPLQNDELQERVKELLGAEKQLKIECATRWGSILAMLERFLEIRDANLHILPELHLCKIFS